MIKKNLKKIFEEMLRIRMVETALSSLYSEQEMRCPMHLCVGQEAIAVGIANNLMTIDVMFSNHRAHGHYLAKGGNLIKLVAELYGKKNGCCGGRGGSMHMIDIKANFLGATPIVGGTVPLAVGSAWASKILGDRKVSVVFFGDGCFEEGVVHESFNFAVLHKLPVIFVCENNNYSVYTKLADRQPKRPLYKVAAAHGLKSYFGNGNDVLEVLNLANKAVTYSRAGKGPCFLEFSTYRWLEHCGPFYDDDLAYRHKKEIRFGKKSCPILKLKNDLVKDNSIDKSWLNTIENKINKEIQNAFKVAKKSKSPTANDIKKFQYA